MVVDRGLVRRALVAIGSVLMIAIAVVWTYWGTAEMYHEGWFGAWTNRLPYLVPIAVTAIPAALCFRRPIVGGAVLVGVGVVAFGFFNDAFVSTVSVLVALAGIVFVWDGMERRRLDRRGGTSAGDPERPARSWWRRDVRAAVLLVLTTGVFVAISAYNLPVVLTRVDDGDRSARRTVGNGVDLVWAPEGPGWNWKQPWGGYPSWQAIALYGAPPIGVGDKPGYGRGAGPGGETGYATSDDMVRTGLCRYLAEDGIALRETPQDIWRMPTADEIVRSLSRHGENAGCAWAGEIGRTAACGILPDKESPLWATDHAAVYYWAADERDEQQGIFVAYNGTVNATRKYGGNPRHSHRCVRAP